MYQGGGGVFGFLSGLFGGKKKTTYGGIDTVNDSGARSMAPTTMGDQATTEPTSTNPTGQTGGGGGSGSGLFSGMTSSSIMSGIGGIGAAVKTGEAAGGNDNPYLRSEGVADSAVQGVSSALSMLGPWGAVAGTALNLVNGIGGSLMNHNSTAKAADAFKLNSDVMQSSSYGGITSGAQRAMQSGQGYKKAGLFGKLFTNTGGMKNDFANSNASQTMASGVLKTNRLAMDQAATGVDMHGANIQQRDYNSQMWNNGSITSGKEGMAIGKDGIHIKKSHEGRFTAFKARTGETTAEAKHSSDPHVRKMATFAANAAKWKHQQGGTLRPTAKQSTIPQQLPLPKMKAVAPGIPLKGTSIYGFKDNQTQAFFDKVNELDDSGKSYKALAKIALANGNPNVLMYRNPDVAEKYSPVGATPHYLAGRLYLNDRTDGTTADSTPENKKLRTDILTSEYLSELPHAMQFSKAPISNTAKWLTNDLPDLIKHRGADDEFINAFSKVYAKNPNATTDDLKISDDLRRRMLASPYQDPNSVEYDAHTIMQPKLEKQFAADTAKHQHGGKIGVPIVTPIATHGTGPGFGNAMEVKVQNTADKPLNRQQRVAANAPTSDPNLAGLTLPATNTYSPDIMNMVAQALDPYDPGNNGAKAVDTNNPGTSAPVDPSTLPQMESGGSMATSGSTQTLTYGAAKKLAIPTVPVKKDGGAINVIADGKLHAHRHDLKDLSHLEDAPMTDKGIPVVSFDDGGEVTQHAEVERDELILHYDLTKQLEELMHSDSDDAILEAGKLLAKEIVKNTKDSKSKVIANA